MGDPLTGPGSYRVILTDEAGNEMEYSFEIVNIPNTAGVAIIVILIVGIIGGGIVVYLLRNAENSGPPNLKTT